ncbi:MAG: pilus assembly protein PilM [Verrucomicrobia bacterium]|nr:pilus assembly protein PilM [Verrucomicrobiota bacterium]
MALPFFSSRAKNREQIVAIDLGGRTTKAVHIQRKGDSFTLLRYALLDAPIYEKNLSAELLTEHLKSVSQALETNTKLVVLAIGVNESIVRHAEMPHLPVDDMRQILKINTKNYLQQELPGHVFDCHILPTREESKPPEGGKTAPGPAKLKVLVGGAKKQLIEDLQAAIKGANLVADQIVPGLIGPVNAFEMAMPEVFAREVVALVDLGFKNSTICLLQEGSLVLSRVVAIGGDKLTSGLAESLNISYAEAEGIKVGMPSEVQSNLESLLTPLGRELRASIDFFEHQQDKMVSQVFISGGSARSEFIVRALQAELTAPCRGWNPTSFLKLSLPPQQMAETEQVAPQLAVALGAAVGAY